MPPRFAAPTGCLPDTPGLRPTACLGGPSCAEAPETVAQSTPHCPSLNSFRRLLHDRSLIRSSTPSISTCHEAESIYEASSGMGLPLG